MQNLIRFFKKIVNKIDLLIIKIIIIFYDKILNIINNRFIINNFINFIYYFFVNIIILIFISIHNKKVKH